MGESPRWHDGRFWVCDWLAGEVLAFSAAGEREVAARFEGLPCSIDWLPDGRLVRHDQRPGVVTGAERAPYGPAGRGLQRDRGGRGRELPGGHARLDAVGGVAARGGGRGPAGRLVRPVVAGYVWFPNGMAIIDEDHARGRRVARRPPHRLDDRRGRHPVGPPGLGPSSATARRPTASASTPRGRSGTPRSRGSTACGSSKAARCWRPSGPTAAASPACSAATTAGRCYIVANHYGPQGASRRGRAHPPRRRTAGRSP